MNPVFTAAVAKGQLIFQDQDIFDKYLIQFEGQPVHVIVRKPKKNRSNQENRYYWGVIIKMLSDETGYSDDEMHDALRMLFLLDREKKIPTLRSTATLSTVEFEDYMSKIRMWASQTLSMYIPEPNEVDF